MKLPQIRMESTFIKLGLNIQKPVQTIEQPKAQQTIEQPRPELNIETIPAKLTIDQSKAWEDMDLKSIFKRTEEFADYGYESWLAGLERRAQQGQELMKIENKGNVIASQAKINGERPEKQFNIGWIPSYFSVKTNYRPAEVKIDWKLNKPNIDVRLNKPIHEYHPGMVTGHIERWNDLKIDYVNLTN
ncbi:DUF6470 family protein [Peribacillus tepidiphilus]|uniref:DUF6470 family protein n=1 Tax=Peribacillus tepidiphilus TaxID=2652445 RepID=UPI0012927921|nr:DUF6470 family protein [Peribacillus tepidiphilus]